ncbi:hypothetical protein BU17DRAFT_37213 [Hysterangium stoloniferum]|nr:hypothetical protein BU17DRAFT_37213 [Hysterangium stoloniferum]
MDTLSPTDAILFPADGRTPHLVQLMSSTVTSTDPMTGRMVAHRIPHPQVHMNYIATNTSHRVWDSRASLHYYSVILFGDIHKWNFQYPYVVFFPILSQSGVSFPMNLNVREIQGKLFKETHAWRGDIVVAKYWDHPYGTLMDCAMSDYPMISMVSMYFYL